MAAVATSRQWSHQSADPILATSPCILSLSLCTGVCIYMYSSCHVTEYVCFLLFAVVMCASCSDTVSQQFCATTIERCNPPPPSLSLSLSLSLQEQYQITFEAVLYYCLFIRDRNFQISHNIIIAEIVYTVLGQVLFA